jgi:type I restriction enzyme, S subunit
MSDLPDGWRLVRLGDVGQWYGGGTPSKARQDFWEDGSIPWLSPKDMRADVLTRTVDCITSAAVAGSAVRLVPAGSVALVVRSGILERTLPVAEVPFATTLNQDMKAVLPRPDVNARFLRFALQAKAQPSLTELRKSGTTVASIDSKALMAIELPVPPVDEQLRIVAVLEDYLSRLKAAEDYLSAGMRRTHALLRSSGAQLLAEPAKAVAISDVLVQSIGGVWGSSPGEDEVDVNVLRVTELRPLGRLDASTAARRSISRKQLTGRQLKAGDLLLEKSGGGPRTPVGRVGLVEHAAPESIFANFMQLLRPDLRRVRPRYLHLLLNALHGSGGTAHLQTASTNIRNIKASEYLRLLVPIPSLQRQDDLVARHEELEGAAIRLHSELRSGRRSGEALRRSVLRASFAGRL